MSRAVRVVKMTPALRAALRREDQASINRRIGGGRAKMFGAAFQERVKRACVFYRLHGPADARGSYPTIRDPLRDPVACALSEVNPPTAGPPGRMRLSGKATVDFVGTWEGLGLAFDCKVITGEASFSPSVRDAHQPAYLLDTLAAGGRAGYLLHDTQLDLIWWLDAREHGATLLAGGRVAVRTKPRGSAPGVGGRGDLIHHLPVLSLAEPPVYGVLRPECDFLALLRLAYAVP